MNLFEIGKEEKLQKTVRILVYPNITFQKDLEKDSYIQVIKQQITLLNQIRNDLWFYLILPEPVPSLTFDNVTQWYVQCQHIHQQCVHILMFLRFKNYLVES